MKRVVISLSGGVDSSVAAYLLKRQGYDVIGLFMVNWDNSNNILTGNCNWEEELKVAEIVARQLKFPLHIVDYSVEYEERIINNMFSEYKSGNTPNPDILCNRDIKFDLLLNKAREFDCDFFATGHYCRIEKINKNGKIISRLLKGVDPGKDQSYFLSLLTQEKLKNVLFPIGHLYKKQVREIAKKANLATSDKRDSQGLCFVGKINLPAFLTEKIENKKGKIIEIPANSEIYKSGLNKEIENDIPANGYSLNYSYDETNGKHIGNHYGIYYYTYGQRKGLNIGGTKEPLYIISLDAEKNIVYVGQGKNHPGLYKNRLKIKDRSINWIREDLAQPTCRSEKFNFKIRYRQPDQPGKLVINKTGAFVLFNEGQRGITPGQFVTWYQNDELIGSGIIEE